MKYYDDILRIKFKLILMERKPVSATLPLSHRRYQSLPNCLENQISSFNSLKDIKNATSIAQIYTDWQFQRSLFKSQNHQKLNCHWRLNKREGGNLETGEGKTQKTHN